MDVNIQYRWCVEWTTEIPLKGTLRRSPDFSFQDSAWFLELNLIGTLRDGYFGIYLCRKEKKSFKEFQLIAFIKKSSVDGEPLLHTFRRITESRTNIWCYYMTDISNRLPNIISGSKLTIVCEFHSTGTNVKQHVSTQSHLTMSCSPIVADDLQSLSRDFSRSLMDENFSDIKLKCGDRTFSAHRLVLASRSEVFSVMFLSKMLERDTGMVDVQDVDPEILELLLEYMYSGKRPDLCDNTASLLYEASDKYAVYGLKNACCEWMLQNQTQENCLDLLVLADKHSDENFKEVMVSFVAEQLPLLSIESWSAMKKDHPQLVFAVLEKRLADVMPCQA